ncbi:rho GTPase-activating protein 23 isoform X4 [Esox lucius]|uniref:rho GTPase-activating protein 23 isoform X4 n=1 Tax=Esox lucius TaxID=8010 RepID=UPI0014770C0F|nr:rho GTPase-activating protein 23 isoform X4 [Esox lucius]
MKCLVDHVGFCRCSSSVSCVSCPVWSVSTSVCVMLGGRVPAPLGQEWCFHCSVGVDCCDPEPRCIWLAALRSIALHTSTTPTRALPRPSTPPRVSPRPKRRVPRRVLPRLHLSWAKGRRDAILSSNENARLLSSAGVEGVAWQGPRTVLLQKNSQGFGFTLRHFIVYPPESSLHNNHKDEENGNANGKGGQRARLEPMDTIFVKSVREKGPAHQAGLCTGDRLVKVNGESVLGKTYSQVIALIQNSDSVLELSIMPKDEDVLQLVSAYSQDVYLRGNEPYTGGAHHLPDPPPLSYPRAKPASSAPPPPNHHSPLDNWHCRPSPISLASPLDNRSAAATATPTSSWHGGPGEPGQDGGAGHFGSSAGGGGGDWRPSLGLNRGRSSSVVGALDFHFANHNAAIASATLPHMPTRKGSLPATRSNTDAMCQQALSDWYYSQAEAAERMSPRHRSMSQDRLAELGLGLALGPGGPGGHGSNSVTSSVAHREPAVSHETLLLHHQSAAASHDSYCLGGWGGASGPGSRSCSESLLAAYASYEHSYGRSQETLAQATALVTPHYQKGPAWPSQGAKEQDKDLSKHHTVTATTAATLATAPSIGQGQQPQVAEPQTQGRRLETEELVGYQSYSPSFCRKAGHLLQQAHSFREPTYVGPHLNWAPSAKSSQSDGEMGRTGGATAAPRHSCTPPSSEDERARLGEERGESRESFSPLSAGQEVVLRQKPPTGRRTPVYALRHPHYTVPVDSAEPPAGLLPSPGAPTAGTPSPGSGGLRLGDSLRRLNGSLHPHHNTPDSLASIPFIDDAISPSADLGACHVPACSVVSSSGAPCPPVPSVSCALPSIATTDSPVVLTTSPLVKLRSRDCSSIKGRRSSYLLAITTERSKSCDEGLNTFREESRVFSRLPKRVKSFFTDGSLESLRVAEEARTKRHSTSELGTITFSDVRKEGWLHYKQILTEKGKKVGGGMRPWKRVFSVLRSHRLFLYKDKREAVLHGAGAGPGHGEDEHPPISIRGCLIDIAYSETKRKHSLRLTTQDFCEYLLQAEDRDDMLGWIRVIRENSKTDNEELGFSRQALINKKLNDYRKQSPTGNKPDASPRAHRMMPPFLLAKTDNTSMNRSSSKDESKATWGINIMKKAKKTGPKVFGVRLEDCQPAVNNKFVPLIVELCCGLVESLGLEYTGVYRVPGNNAMVSSLQEQLNKGLEINVTEERWQDLNVISSLLKSFFRKLPEPLFTDDKYNDFIDANRLEDSGDRMKTMKKLILDLPDHYRHTLKFLVCHLKTVADHADKNKMEPRNLALVFGPTLVRTSEDNMTDMVTHMPDRYKIIETLILHHDWFFSDGELSEDEKAPVDIKRDTQPVPNIDHLLSNIGRTGLPGGEASDSTTSDSAKDKATLGSKKDVCARDFLSRSIISAVTRKRKKRPISRPLSSSTDEDSEHEPVKASNYRGGATEQEEGVGTVVTEHAEKKGKEEDRKRIEAKQQAAKGGVEEAREAGVKNGGSAWTKTKEGAASPQARPTSFLYTHYHSPTTTSPSHPVEASVSPHSKLPGLPRGRSIGPTWLSPSRVPGPIQPSNTKKTEQQPLPVRYRKTRSGRARAQSMNLDLIKAEGEGGIGRRDDGAEAIRATTRVHRHRSSSVGVPQGCVAAPFKVQGSTRSVAALAPASVLSPPLPSPPPPGRTDQRSFSSTVVMRRSALEPRDKRRAWRRHTVVV